MTYSFSGINSFLRCPKQYFYRYIQKLRIETKSPALIHGKNIHEQIHKKDYTTKDARFAKQFKKAARLQNTLAGFPIYQDQDKVFIEFSEEKFGLTPEWKASEFDDKSALFRGIIDYARLLLDKENLKEGDTIFDGIMEIELFDWKTGNSRANPRQLESYALYFQSAFGVNKIKCTEVYLTKKETRSWEAGEKELEDTKTWILAGIEKINQEKTWEVKPCGLCDYCDYKEFCEDERETKEKETKEKLTSLESLSSLRGGESVKS